MKNNFFAWLLLTLSIFIVSCKKNEADKNPMRPPVNARTFRFILYTDQNFSTDSSVIHFTVFIKKGSVYVYDPNPDNILYDSAFATHADKRHP